MADNEELKLTVTLVDNVSTNLASLRTKIQELGNLPQLPQLTAGVLALIQACLFFIVIQRYLVQGLTAGAVKG